MKRYTKIFKETGVHRLHYNKIGNYWQDPSSVGKNLDITDIIKKPTGNDLIQIKFKDHELRLTRIEAQELIDLLLKRLK